MGSLAVSLLLSGCATWSQSEVLNPNTAVREIKQVTPEQVKLTEGDITNRPYISLGDLSVTVNKTTIFHPEPTREMVDSKLKEEAAKLGADAVIYVRYGTVGISALSWGSLDGKGRAIQFTDN
ncbi:hypothetical protein [Sulfurospirillum sp.]|uniref:hypothetical protein n=1 Tax=Sulfurospirillum sp. TaxID=2053622 RepID=UPI002FDE107E